jgi:dipeptidyl aminopeptidase/acylaminoacyl peptidase
VLYATRTNGALWAYDPRSGHGQQVLATQQVGSSVSSQVSATGFTTERFRDRVAVVELASGGQVELLGPFPAGVRTAQLAPDGSRVVVLTKDGTLRVYGCPACAPLPDLVAEARRRLGTAP